VQNHLRLCKTKVALRGDDGVVDSGDEDLRLSPDSPYIDAGDNDLVPADVLDVDINGNVVEPHPWDIYNHPRIRDGDGDDQVIVDIGAFEYPAGRLGDADFDGDIDLVDWQRNRVCLKGPEDPMPLFARGAPLTGPMESFGGSAPPGAVTPSFRLSYFCEPADMDLDQDVDLRDMSQWIDAFGTQD